MGNISKLGIVTTGISLTYMIFGLPSQILQIWSNHSVKDISILLFILLVMQSLFWIAYGISVSFAGIGYPFIGTGCLSCWSTLSCFVSFEKVFIVKKY